MKRIQSKAQSLKSKAALLWAFIVVALCSQDCFAQSTNAPVRLSYDSFRPISDRNIFNPNRYARRSGSQPPRTASQPASRVESFSLVGIMAYEKGWFAFFDGTKSNYKQTLQQDGTIGEYRVTHITPEVVKLALGTNTFDLKVGMQMRREDEGDWFLSEGGETTRRRVVSTRTRTRGGARGEESIPGETSDMVNGEPEIIVIESETPAEITEGETPAANGNGNNNGEAARVEPEADNGGGVTDPVLLRLMQRRQQMNQ